MLRSEMHHSFDDLKETLRDSQTELLMVFYNFSQTNDERIAATENDTTSLKQRYSHPGIPPERR